MAATIGSGAAEAVGGADPAGHIDITETIPTGPTLIASLASRIGTDPMAIRATTTTAIRTITTATRATTTHMGMTATTPTLRSTSTTRRRSNM